MVAFAAGGAAFDVGAESGGGPGVILFGVEETALTEVERDALVGHGFRGSGHLVD